MVKLGTDDPNEPGTLRDHLRSFALLVIGLGLIYTAHVSNKQAQWDVRSCEQQNAVREEINKRGHILQNFLESAAKTRHATALIQIEQGLKAEAELNLKAARDWEAWAGEIDALELTACEEVLADAGATR